MRNTASVGTRRLVFLACALAGCGPDSGRGGGGRDGGADGGSGIPGLASIDVTPANASFTIVNGAPASGDFVATGHFQDGHLADVTAQVGWSLADGGLGTVDKGHYTSITAHGGKTMLQASDGVHQGSAQLVLKYSATRVSTDDGSTAPADSATKFAGATNEPTLAPPVVYPLDGVLAPRNLGELEVQWKKPAAAADLFEVSFVSPTFELEVYTNAVQPQGGRLSLLNQEWSALADSVAGSGVNVAVRALAVSDPTKIGGSSPVVMNVGTDEVKGGIYYWSAAGAAGTVEGIKRHQFGDTTSPAAAFYTQNDAVFVNAISSTTHCVACHVLSRDGTKFAVTYDGGNDTSALFDVATKTSIIAPSVDLAWNFAAMSPDGMRMVGSHDGVIKIYDISGGATTGTVLGTVPTAGWGTHPDWSPDGKSLVFVRTPSASVDWGFTKGSIVVMTDDGMGNFNNPMTIVTSAGENNYYPSFSPDNKWILFDRSTGDSYDDPDATLYVISADGKIGPIRLNAANAMGQLTNSWPRWSPFVQTNGPNGDLLYFTFSSKRDYGIEMGSLNAGNPTRPQVWMSAFDPKIASGNMDPSDAPFWLPFQDVMTNNHIAQWTQAIVGIN